MLPENRMFWVISDQIGLFRVKRGSGVVQQLIRVVGTRWERSEKKDDHTGFALNGNT